MTGRVTSQWGSSDPPNTSLKLTEIAVDDFAARKKIS
jgi:hypothetical protein